MVKAMASKLEQLRGMTVVVADTGDIDAVRRLKPQDCTTNPSLLLKAVENPAYSHLLEEAIAWGRGQSASPDAVAVAVCDRLAVSFGAELAKIVPGRVSIEADADLSFDTRATVDKARAIIAACEARGVTRDRILVKVASTFEGIRAAEALQREQIDCNLTLLFSLLPAAAPTRRKPIRAWRRCAASLHITRLTACAPPSWAPRSATPARSRRWRAATASPSRRRCSTRSRRTTVSCRDGSIRGV